MSGVRIAVYVAALDERPPLELSAELELVVLGAARASSCPSRRASPSCRTRDVPAYAVDLPGGERLIVWGITYAILERLRALPAEH